jgi:prepilin-type N-terminal cleavage/methylation domain-containing protein
MVKRLNCYKGPRTAKVRGLTLVELLVVVVVIAILGFLVMSGVPTARDKSKAMQAACESNLKQIGIACRTWEGDYDDLYPMRYYTNADGTAKYADGSNVFRYFQVMSNEINNPKVLICPSDERGPAADFEHLKNQNVSYFAGLDADETRPPMLLSGDRNLVTNGVDIIPGLVVIGTNTKVDWSAKMHNLTGNFGLADGSVQKGSSRTFQLFAKNAGTNAIRLAVP